MPSSPPSSRTVTRRPVSPRRAVTTAAAQAPEPQASVIMPPRSQTRIRMVSRSITWTNSTLVRSGNSGSCSNRGPDRGEVDRLGVGHHEDAVRVAHADRARGAGERQRVEVHRARERHLVPAELRRSHVDPGQPVAGVLGAEHAAAGPELERRRAALGHQHAARRSGWRCRRRRPRCRRRSRSRPRPPPRRRVADHRELVEADAAVAVAERARQRRRHRRAAARGRRSRRSRCRARASSGT